MTPHPALPDADKPFWDTDTLVRPRRKGGRARPAPGERAWANRFQRGSLEELRHARELVARLVLTHGEWILPIFEKLDDEVARRERHADSLDRVRRLAGARA